MMMIEEGGNGEDVCLRNRSERLSTHEDAGRLSRLEVICPTSRRGARGA